MQKSINQSVDCGGQNGSLSILSTTDNTLKYLCFPGDVLESGIPESYHRVLHLQEIGKIEKEMPNWADTGGQRRGLFFWAGTFWGGFTEVVELTVLRPREMSLCKPNKVLYII